MNALHHHLASGWSACRTLFSFRWCLEVSSLTCAPWKTSLLSLHSQPLLQRVKQSPFWVGGVSALCMDKLNSSYVEAPGPSTDRRDANGPVALVWCLGLSHFWTCAFSFASLFSFSVQCWPEASLPGPLERRRQQACTATDTVLDLPRVFVDELSSVGVRQPPVLHSISLDMAQQTLRRLGLQLDRHANNTH